MSLITRLFARARRPQAHPAPSPAAPPPSQAAVPVPMAVRSDPPSFADLSETPDPALLPLLDRPGIDETGLDEAQRHWRREGYVILRGFLPDAITLPYIERRACLREVSHNKHLSGWSTPSPYEHVEELRHLSLYPPLMAMLERLIGEPMLLHLNLTGWSSTERNWHQDDYLNPAHVNSWYVAVWMALGEVGADCGPFEFIPGSHHWPLLRGERVRACMSEAEREARTPEGYETWPKTSERFVVPAIEQEIARRATPSQVFLAKRGDVLIWHGRLMHRGSAPRVPGSERPALIAHYSGINHRPDMPNRLQDENGAWYAQFGHKLT